MTRLLKEALPSFLFGINFEKQAETRSAFFSRAGRTQSRVLGERYFVHNFVSSLDNTASIACGRFLIMSKISSRGAPVFMCAPRYFLPLL